MMWPFRRVNGHATQDKDEDVEFYEAEHKKAVAKVHSEAKQLNQITDALDEIAEKLRGNNVRPTG